MKIFFVSSTEDYSREFEVDDDALHIQVGASDSLGDRITWVDFSNKKYCTYNNKNCESTAFDFPKKSYQIRRIGVADYTLDYI